MIASEIGKELERLTVLAAKALTTQEDQIEGLLVAQYNFTMTITRLQNEIEALKKENDDLWKQINWKKEEA